MAPRETVTLAFETAKFKYIPQSSAGAKGGPLKLGVANTEAWRLFVATVSRAIKPALAQSDEAEYDCTRSFTSKSPVYGAELKWN